jgi:hypothetical protein
MHRKRRGRCRRVWRTFGRNLEVNMQKPDIVYVCADDIVPLI